VLDAFCNDTNPDAFGHAPQQVLGGASRVRSMLQQLQRCKDPNEDICAEIAAARSRLQSNQTMRQKYQELIDKINRGEFAGTFEDAQNEIVRGVNGTVLAEPVWDERVGRAKIGIHPPPPGTTGRTATAPLATLMHESRQYYH